MIPSEDLPGLPDMKPQKHLNRGLSLPSINSFIPLIGSALLHFLIATILFLQHHLIHARPYGDLRAAYRQVPIYESRRLMIVAFARTLEPLVPQRQPDTKMEPLLCRLSVH